MLYLALLRSGQQDPAAGRPVVLAARNVHKAFLYACAMLDCDVEWIYPENTDLDSVCSCHPTPEQVRSSLEQMAAQGRLPFAVYITSPDYLGNLADIKSISQICKIHGVPLLVDNAHGTYTAFLKDSLHPIALGADICCDSAHKTLPCYTGCAYLHISKSANAAFLQDAKRVMSLFGSTSPSYLLLQSLDLCGDLLASGEFSKQLQTAAERLSACKRELSNLGWQLCGSEPMKITICAAKCGYDGKSLADILRQNGIEPEYSDVQFVVLMAGISNTQSDFDKLISALGNISVKPPIDNDFPPVLPSPRQLPIRQAALQKGTTVSIDDAVGRTCALSVTACQPSVPVVVSGETITADIVKILKRYSIFVVNVL